MGLGQDLQERRAQSRVGTGDLEELHSRLIARWPTRVTLSLSPIKKVFVDDSLSLGARLATDGLSISFFVDGAEEKVGFSPNLGRFVRHDDPTHNAVDVKKRFQSLLDSFVAQVKARLQA